MSTDILLVEPPFYTLRNVHHSNFPLGLEYLASCLIAEGYAVRIYCCDTGATKKSRFLARRRRIASGNIYKTNLADKSLEVWREFIYVLKKEKPKIVGITALTDFVDSAWECAKIIKEILPQCKVILGGPHITVNPGYLVGKYEIDYGLRGESEIGLIKLVNWLLGKKKKNPLHSRPMLCQ